MFLRITDFALRNCRSHIRIGREVEVLIDLDEPPASPLEEPELAKMLEAGGYIAALDAIADIDIRRNVILLVEIAIEQRGFEDREKPSRVDLEAARVGGTEGDIGQWDLRPLLDCPVRCPTTQVTGSLYAALHKMEAA